MIRTNYVKIAKRVHKLFSLSENEVPSAKYAHPSVTDSSLSKVGGGWHVQAYDFLGRTPI